METLSPPVSVRRVPVGSGVFVGRAAELKRLDAVLTPSGRAGVAVIHGLGGVGKSTLAARFAERRSDRFALVWWVAADSPAAIGTGVARLAVALAPEAAPLPLEQRVELGLRWLASHDDWLLVLDDVTGPADAVELLERVRTGSILITSRHGRGWRSVPTVPLGVLAADEASEMLARVVRAEWPEARLRDGERLCAELGWLPLAIEQAGAYLAQTRVTPTAYLELLARFPAETYAALAEGEDPQRTIARVWKVTLDRLADTPLAGQILHVLAWYAPDSIPRALFDRYADDPAVLSAFGRLAAYSMITLREQTLDVHPLVQAVTRTPDPADPCRQAEDIARARATATVLLSDSITGRDPVSPEDRQVFQVALPHTRALLAHTRPDDDLPETCVLAARLGNHLSDRGDATTAVDFLVRAASSLSRLHTPEHPTTLTAQNNLAVAYQRAGDPQSAIRLFEITLADRERVLGPDHPDTLASRNNLATGYQEIGDLESATPLYERTMADSERLRGPDDPYTALARNNLAGAYRVAGDVERAITLYEQALVDTERLLGRDHPSTLTVRHNLACSYDLRGDSDRAIAQLQATVADRQRVLGTDHPDTLLSLNELANTYATTDRPERAIPLWEAVLVDREQVLGHDHPDTLLTRKALADTYLAHDHHERAVPLYETLLAYCERQLGTDHRTTTAVRSSLVRATAPR
ncbi:tetratricopeptide repeat protein [Actinosynnema sp. NPDC050436]|uniref:tetratricopeptide repeat protein n=1 Tax=Actinosynnema sp. NPDC050436 TaxID=3155659 RepID=UPI0033E6EB43